MGFFDDIGTEFEAGFKGIASLFSGGDDAPTPIAPLPPPTLGTETQTAEEEEEGKQKGQAANILTGGMGLSGGMGQTSRSVLLGS